MEKLKKLKTKYFSLSVAVRAAVWFTFCNLLQKGITMISMPIFTRLLTTEQYGEFTVYQSWYSIINVIVTFNLSGNLILNGMSKYENRRNEFISSIQTLSSCITICFFIAYLIFHNFFNHIFGLSTLFMVTMFAQMLFEPAYLFWSQRQRYEYKYKLSGCVTIGSAILASVLSVVAVLGANSVGHENIAEVRLYANYLVVYGVAAVIWVCLFWKGKTLYNKEYWKLSLSLSIPLIGYSIAAQILSVSDRMMISQMVNNSAVGIYSTLYTVSSLSLMLWQAIHASFVPYLFQNIESNVKGIKRISSQIMLLYAVMAVMMTYMAPEIVRILATEEYYEAIYIMPPIAAGVFFTAFANIYSDIAVYYKKTQYVMYPAVIAAVANLVLNYIFINAYGYMAAAYTTLFSYILMALFQGIWARKLCKENGIAESSVFEDRKLILLACVTTVLCLLGIALYNFYIIRYLIIVLMAVLSIVFYKKYKTAKKN